MEIDVLERINVKNMHLVAVDALVKGAIYTAFGNQNMGIDLAVAHRVVLEHALRDGQTVVIERRDDAYPLITEWNGGEVPNTKLVMSLSTDEIVYGWGTK